MPRVYKTKKGSKERTPLNKEKLKRAVYDVIEYNKSLRGTAKSYGLSVMTLKRYVKKKREAAAAGGSSPVYEPDYKQSLIFTHEEESDLAIYLETASKLHHGLTPKATRELAYQFAIANGKKIHNKWHENKIASYAWLHGFMKRNKNLSLRVPEATSLSRATSFNRHNVSKFFTNLKDVYLRHNFEAHDIWNIDETGITTVHKPKKIIACKGLKQVSKMTSAERGELITVCSAINASGSYIPPFFIFPRKNWQIRMIDNAPPGSAGATHPSGWMTAPNFVLFLQHFKKHVRCSKENPCLIIFDNHDSHISIDSVNFARDNGITLLTIPPHTSQKLQPLDRILFGSLKSYYNTACDDWMLAHPGRPITIYDVAGCLGKAYPTAMTPRNIMKSFEITGIYPFNSEIFTDDEYLSSYVTDRLEETISGPGDRETIVQEISITIEPLTGGTGPGQNDEYATDAEDILEGFQNNTGEERLSSPVITDLFDFCATHTPLKENTDQNKEILTSPCSLAQLSFMAVNNITSKARSDGYPDALEEELPTIKQDRAVTIRHANATPSMQYSSDVTLPLPSTSSLESGYRVTTTKVVEDSQKSFSDTQSPLMIPTQNIPQSTPLKYFSPEILRPHPKAAPRKSNTKGRKKGSTKIITDTPEKIILEQETLSREEKKRKKAAKLVKKNLKDNTNKQKGKRQLTKKGPKAKRQRRNSNMTSSEDEENILPPSPESDYSLEREIEVSSEEEEEVSGNDEDNVHEGDWVVVNFISQRSVPHRYVGQVINESLASLDVKFAKKVTDKKFKWPQKPDVSLIAKYQVVQKLPPPTFKSSSKRIGAFDFPKSLRRFKIDRT